MHPGEENGRHELYLMCADIEAFVVDMAAQNVACVPVTNQGWGLLTMLTLPGAGAGRVSAAARRRNSGEVNRMVTPSGAANLDRFGGIKGKSRKGWLRARKRESER